MQRVFFHIHIWKTGGTSFFNICSENFGKSFHRDIMLIQNWFLSVEQLRWLLDYHSWVRCYSCHMLSGDLPYNHESRQVVGIAFVRNPVNRFISSYNFQRGENYRGGIAKAHGFDEFFTNALVKEDNPWWRNGQTFILGGSGTDAGYDRIAERVDKGQLILLPMERFDECCVLLERLFPDDFKACSYKALNVSRQTQPVSDAQRDAIAAYMDTDLKLLSLANAYLDSTLAGLFEDMNERQHYLDDFRHRCESKSQQIRLAHITKKIRGTLKSTLSKLAGRA